MRTIIIIPVLLFSLLLGAPSYSADLNKGLTAYNKGDYATALKEWKPLAEQGNEDAQYNLGLMYRKGLGVPQDYKVAVQWYTLSAEQGNVNAQNNLGIKYEQGLGVPQDYKVAVRWYTLAAEQGNTIAQNNLGYAYAKGQAVIQDYVYAHMWWDIAATNGDDYAKSNKSKVKGMMSSSQIEKAQNLAKECVKKNYKGF